MSSLLQPSGNAGHVTAEMRARQQLSQTKCGPARKDADLTDDRQIQGNWIDSSYRCAHPCMTWAKFSKTGRQETLLPARPDQLGCSQL